MLSFSIVAPLLPEFVQTSHLRIPQKPQVPVISRQLVAFAAPRCSGRKWKSPKSCCFLEYLGLFAFVRRGIRSDIASANSTKAPSPADFKATCCIYRSEMKWQKVEKPQVMLFSYILGAFSFCSQESSSAGHVPRFVSCCSSGGRAFSNDRSGT